MVALLNDGHTYAKAKECMKEQRNVSGELGMISLLGDHKSIGETRIKNQAHNEAEPCRTIQKQKDDGMTYYNDPSDKDHMIEGQKMELDLDIQSIEMMMPVLKKSHPTSVKQY